MQRRTIIALTAGVSFLIGAGGVYLPAVGSAPTSGAAGQTQLTSPSAPEIIAILLADPALSHAVMEGIGPDHPTDAEAQTAINLAHRNSPLAYNPEGDAPIGVRVGPCDTNNIGPGVSCVITLKYTPAAKLQSRVAGFAKNSNGEWFATSY